MLCPADLSLSTHFLCFVQSSECEWIAVLRVTRGTHQFSPDFLSKWLEIGIASWNAPPEKVLIYAGFRGFENEKIFEFSPSVLPIFQSGLGEDTTWRVVRVVEGATLEKSCAARHLGFESLTLRQPEKPVLPASLFYSRFPIPKPASIASAEITFELYSRCA